MLTTCVLNVSLLLSEHVTNQVMYLLFFPLSSYNTHTIKNVHEYTGKQIYQYITPSNKQQKCFYHSQYITVYFTSLSSHTLA
jgi:hypothetical protein